MPYSIILDCYTDEPSGYGVRPYLGTHQIHLSQALAYLQIEHYLLTIDDLRYAAGNTNIENDISVYNVTKNKNRAADLLENAEKIYIIMGCFVDYDYFSCSPPKSSEVAELFARFDVKSEIVLFYVMGTIDGISPDYSNSELSPLVSIVEHGNTYRFVLEGKSSTPFNNLINPDYKKLAEISQIEAPIIEQTDSLIIAEIETGTGCNTPTCKFCIESLRSPRVIYREPEDISSQVVTLYKQGVRHFRLGRQPNFFHYAFQNTEKLRVLLSTIRNDCPDLKMLHIDNANIVNVANKSGKEFTKIITEFCTPGNIAPFGIETFDDEVRKATGVVGSADLVMKAIEVLNEYGSERGENGLPKLLPGVNIIFGLPGQTNKTHEINMNYLQKILDAGYLTQRLYYRQMTQPTGSTFSEKMSKDKEFNRNFQEIVERFVIPMQDRVYPKNLIISGDVESIPYQDGQIMSRFLATCSIKMIETAPNNWQKQRQSISYKIKKNLGYRKLEVKCLN